jgi:hypothetical protein
MWQRLHEETVNVHRAALTNTSRYSVDELLNGMGLAAPWAARAGGSVAVASEAAPSVLTSRIWKGGLERRTVQIG